MEYVSDGETNPGTISNISMGGILVEFLGFVEYGSKGKLVLDLPGIDEKCRIPCVVRWINDSRGAGLHFEQLRAIETWALSKLVRRLSEEGEPV